MKRRTFLATAAGVPAVALAGCVGSGLSKSQYDVGMSLNSFEPEEYATSVGETVVWGNSGSRPHSVTAFPDGIPEGADYFASGGFESREAAEAGWRQGEGVIAPGETYRHTFEVPGTYDYYCIPHLRAGMTGRVVVEE